MTWDDPTREPTFPPLLSGRRIVPGERVGDAAVNGALSGRLGAGDLLWDGDPLRVDLAVVLEPEVSLRRSAEILPLTLVALGDALGALAPPQVGVMFRWPDVVTVNGAPVGGVGVSAAACGLDQTPDWLVVAVGLQMRFALDADEPGRMPETTALAEEGCEDLSNVDIMDAFARHFLTWLNLWQGDGFEPVRQSWLARAEGRDGAVRLGAGGEPVLVTGMDAKGNLLVTPTDDGRQDRAGVALALVDALRLVAPDAGATS